MRVLLCVAWLSAVKASGLQCWQPDLQPFSSGQNLSAGRANGSPPPPTASTRLPPHPRLRLNNKQLAGLNRTIQTDPTAKAYFDGLALYGETFLALPPSCEQGFRTRATLTMQYTLGLLWRLTGDERFAARATQELLHVTSNCTDWDPNFGLNLAEMIHAVGIGFDWLFHYLTPAQRQTIVAGVNTIGFGAALAQYDHHPFWANCTFNWGIVTNGGFTIGGLAFADEPVAVANVTAVLAKAAVGLQCPFSSFAPHGAWHEGAMYWGYVAHYALATTDALRGVYGNDRGLSSAPGFNETALFRLHMNGPSQTSFDFGDSLHSDPTEFTAAGYLMDYSALATSNRQLRNLCAYEARRLAKIYGGYNYSKRRTSAYNSSASAVLKYNCSTINCARLLIHYSPAGNDADLQALPTAKVFKMSAFGWDGRDAIGFFRSGWSVESEGANGKHAYLAFKAANGLPNHNDLDGGTFVFEAGGQRWGMDMSSDNYNLTNYFTQSLKFRYSYYRKSTAGHNTLTFNNDWADQASRAYSDQNPGLAGRTQITLFQGTGTVAASTTAAAATTAAASEDATLSSSPAYSVVDLTAAYSLPGQNSSRVERGFAFSASYERLFIVDEFAFSSCSDSGAPPHNVTWSMHTMATIKLHAAGSDDSGGSAGGRTAVLSLGGARLYATVLEPKGAVFSAASVNLQPPYKPSIGVNKLLVFLPLPPPDGIVGTSKGWSKAGPASRIVVGLSLNATAPANILNPLAYWGAAGPFAGEI
eukprot:gene12448-30134_t